MAARQAGFYPLVLRLRGRRVLVVGGGKVAARRVTGLLEAGAHVVVVSPVFSPAFVRLISGGAVTSLQRPYQSSDVADMALVIAATDDPKVNAQVRRDARRAGVLVTVADDPENSDFIVPAVVRRGDLLFAISSGGASPGLVGQLRRELDLLVPEDAAVLVRLLAKARQRVQRAVTDPERRRELMNRLLTLDLLSALRTGGSEAVVRQIDDLIAPAAGHRPAPHGVPPAGDRTQGRPAPAEGR